MTALSTTTFDAIRRNYYALFRLLTPNFTLRPKFDAAPARENLRDWALRLGAQSTSLRRFEIREVGSSRHLGPDYPDAREIDQAAVLLVAYPVLPAIYGRGDRDDLEKTVELDRYQLEDVLWSPGNYLPGHTLCAIQEGGGVDRSSNAVWFNAFVLKVQFYRAMTLTT